MHNFELHFDISEALYVKILKTENSFFIEKKNSKVRFDNLLLVDNLGFDCFTFYYEIGF